MNHSSSLKIVLSCLLLGLVSLPCAYARPFVLDLDAEHYNPTQIGGFIADKVKEKFPDIEKQYDSFLVAALSPMQYEQLLPQIESLKATVAPAYQAEVNAIAGAWQLTNQNQLGDGRLSVSEFWLLQLLTDVTDINKGSAFAVINRNDKNPIVARNVDWKSAHNLKNLQTLTIYHYKNRTLVNIGFAGLVSVISAFNDQGLFVSLIDASTLQANNAPNAEQVSSFELRTVLMTLNNITAASRALAQHLYPRHQQIVLADAENIAVLEQPAAQLGVSRQTDSTLINEMPWHNSQQFAVVNCFVLKTSPHNCYTTEDHYQWQRFAQLSKALAEQTLSVNQVANIMQDQTNTQQAIFNPDTVQSIVFTPKDRVLHFTAATHSLHNENPIAEKYHFIQTLKTRPPYKQMVLGMLAVMGIAALVWFSILHTKRKSIQT